MEENKNLVCSLCGKKIESIWNSHNAQPLNNGRCCGDCNTTKVIPARLERANKGENIYEVKEENQ